MSDSAPWIVRCHETGDGTGDGTGDAFVTLQPETLTKLGLDIGDVLLIEVVNGVIVLKPTRDTPHPS